MPQKTQILQLRVSAKQKRIIENLAELNGFRNISEFIRKRALESDFIELKLNEIKELLENEKISKNNQQKKM